MLKILAVALPAVLFVQIATPTVAAPQKRNPAAPKEVFLGTFAPGESYATDVYVVPSTIRNRGELRRYQIHDVYKQEQDAGGYKFQQSIVFWVANCREGTSGAQRAENFNSQGNRVGELLMELKMKVPLPGSLNEKVLDFVCDYKL